MKLKVLAVAVAASFAFPMAAQAELKIGGDVGIFYTDSKELQELGSEINFDGSSEIDGVTYYGHMELDVNGTGNSVRMDEVRVGAKGGFGEVILGEVDNACDQFDPGSNDIWLGGQSSSCGGSDVNNIVYKNTMGNASFAVSHNPNADESALGVKMGMGPVSVNLGYEDLDGTDLISYGVAGSFNGIDVSAEGNDNDAWGVNASYSMGNSTFWAATGHNDDVGLGARTSHGNMDYIIEFAIPDEGGTAYVAGLRYRF